MCDEGYGGFERGVEYERRVSNGENRWRRDRTQTHRTTRVSARLQDQEKTTAQTIGHAGLVCRFYAILPFSTTIISHMGILSTAETS